MFFCQYLYVQLILLVLSVSAFYPYVPPWMCTETSDCPEPKKRSENAITAEVEKTVKNSFTLKIRQRLPSNNLPHEVQVSRYIDRLTEKYKAQNNAKRANSYPVIFSTTPTQAYSAAIDQDGTDFSYFAVAKFGSNGTPLFMLMDTGASSSWVMGSSCTSDACLRHNTFGPANSKTYQASSGTFSIGYGTGSVSGLLVTDTISFAGFSFPFTFGAANQTSKDFINFPMDGILGLAQAPGSKPPTFLESLASSKALPSNLFGININRAVDGTNDGEINFGTPDKSKYVGNLGYTSTIAAGGNWNIPLDDAGISNKFAGFQGKTAIIDSGTSYAFIPAADAKVLYALIPGAQLSSDGSYYSVPCSTTTPLQIKFSGVVYTISSKDWVGGPYGALCTCNIYPRDATGIGAWLLGDLFLKNVYAVFDVDQNRVGFGVKSTAGSASSSTAQTSAKSTGMESSSSLSRTIVSHPVTVSDRPLDTSGSSPSVVASSGVPSTIGMKSSPSLSQTTFSPPVTGSDRPSATPGSSPSVIASSGVSSSDSSNAGSTVIASSSSRTATTSSIASTSTSDTSQGFNAAITSKSSPTGVAQSVSVAAPASSPSPTNASTQLDSTLIGISAGILISLLTNL